jgi:RNA polymerase sporulation-specific sigma factor
VPSKGKMEMVVLFGIVKNVLRNVSLIISLVAAKLFPRRVYYINGPDMLPAPLSAQDEAETLAFLEDGGETAAKARSTLIVHNLRLVVYIAKKFENTGIGVEDLVSIGTIGLIKAVNTFCPSRNIKLATYASRCIENEILMYLRKSSGLKNEVSIDEPLNIDWDGNELLLSDVLGTENDIVHQNIEKDVERTLLEDAIGHLSNRERTIMEMRFGLRDGIERTQKEVADTLGISQSYISRLEKRIIVRLRKEIERVS